MPSRRILYLQEQAGESALGTQEALQVLQETHHAQRDQMRNPKLKALNSKQIPIAEIQNVFLNIWILSLVFV